MPDPSRSILRASGAGILGLVLAVAGCQTSSPTPSASDGPPAPASASATASARPGTPSPSATASEAAEGRETSVFDLESGDCFTAGDVEIVSVLVVDCEEPHVYEAFAVFDHEAGPDEEYPGDEAMAEYADTACQPPFEAYVGGAYEDSIWFITSISPTAETWAEGDREIVCTLSNEDDTEVTGSAEGSGE